MSVAIEKPVLEKKPVKFSNLLLGAGEYLDLPSFKTNEGINERLQV
jgi:hypothetical protein